MAILTKRRRGRANAAWVEAEVVRAHHRELRNWTRFIHLGQHSKVYHRVLGESLSRLAQQGYGMDEIGVMFGVSRERVRQWAKRYGLTAQFRALGKGTKPRVWDPEQNQFVPITWGATKQKQASERSLRYWAMVEQRRRAGRRKDLATLKALAERLGDTPTLEEYSEALGFGWQAAAMRFRGRPSQRFPIPWGSLARRLYRMAGLKVRSVGSPGWRT